MNIEVRHNTVNKVFDVIITKTEALQLITELAKCLSIDTPNVCFASCLVGTEKEVKIYNKLCKILVSIDMDSK